MQQEQEQQTGMIWDYISPSRLSLWMKCPLAFRRRYIEGVQTAPTPALFVGKVVHAILAHIYRMRQAGHVCKAESLPMIVADAWKYAMETEPC
jgi:putative RecB family exonuclease